MPDAVRALFMGPMHVLVEVNANWREQNPEPPPIGVPAREQWIDPVWAPAQAMMDATYEDGIQRVAVLPHGTMTISAWPDGVGTAFRAWRPQPASRPDRRPARPVSA